MWSEYSSTKKPTAMGFSAVPASDSTSPFPEIFFAALKQGKDDEALAYLRAEARPAEGAPSPRAQELIDSGTALESGGYKRF